MLRLDCGRRVSAPTQQRILVAQLIEGGHIYGSFGRLDLGKAGSESAIFICFLVVFGTSLMKAVPGATMCEHRNRAQPALRLGLPSAFEFKCLVARRR
jgi:hypothetical protein